MVPTALDAQPKATSLGRSWRMASKASMSSVTSSGRMSTVRTTSPRSAAALRHGPTFASWSSDVTTTVSPGCSEAATERARCIVSVVMFAPSLISEGSAALSRSARAACASSTTASLRRDVRNVPSWFAFEVR